VHYGNRPYGRSMSAQRREAVSPRIATGLPSLPRSRPFRGMGIGPLGWKGAIPSQLARLLRNAATRTGRAVGRFCRLTFPVRRRGPIRRSATPLIVRPSERGGRQLAKEQFVCAGEPSELPEAVPGSNFCHGCRGWGTLPKIPLRQMHSAQQQVSLGAHSQLFLAAKPQGPFRHADRHAELRNENRLIGLFLQRPAKSVQDDRVLTQRSPVLASVSGARGRAPIVVDRSAA
jgi:hypothetical protein